MQLQCYEENFELDEYKETIANRTECNISSSMSGMAKSGLNPPKTVRLGMISHLIQGEGADLLIDAKKAHPARDPVNIISLHRHRSAPCLGPDCRMSQRLLDRPGNSSRAQFPHCSQCSCEP